MIHCSDCDGLPSCSLSGPFGSCTLMGQIKPAEGLLGTCRVDCPPATHDLCSASDAWATAITCAHSSSAEQGQTAYCCPRITPSCAITENTKYNGTCEIQGKEPDTSCKFTCKSGYVPCAQNSAGAIPISCAHRATWVDETVTQYCCPSGSQIPSSCPNITGKECQSSQSGADVVLHWSAVEGANRYKVIRNGKSVWIGEAQSYLDTNIETNTNYTYDIWPGYYDNGWIFKEDCSQQAQISCDSASVSPTPVPVACQAVQIYQKNSDGAYSLLTQEQIKSLTAGDEVYFGVTYVGNQASKARVRVNESTWKETHNTLEKETIDGIKYFISTYTLPEGVYNFKVEAQVSAHGWD